MNSKHITPQSRSTRLTVSQNSALGMVCGMLATLISQPLVYCKNNLQQNIAISLKVRVMYRGLGPALLNYTTQAGLQFTLTELSVQSLSRLTGAGGVDGMFCTLAGAFAGGFATGLWAGPIQLAMIQQQRFGMPLSKCMYKLLREFRFDFFRGTLSTCILSGRPTRV